MDWHERWLVLAVASIVLLFCISLYPVFAHDHNNPERTDWLKSLHSQNKTWCCDGNDTDIIEQWETRNGRYRVRFRGEWYDVPDSAVVDGPNKGGDALLWMNKGYSGLSVRCFMPGALS